MTPSLFSPFPRVAMTAAALLLPHFSSAQIIQPQVFERVQGHVNEPAKLTATTSLVAGLRLPPGFKVNQFEVGLEAPRMLALGANGNVYVTRRHPHNDVWLLRDTNGDGAADVKRQVASIQHVHGIALRGGKAYLAAVRQVFVADVAADGSLGFPRALYSDLPDAGQHPNRTLKFSPDGRLFLSVGSTNNAAPEPNRESATMLLLSPAGGSRSIFARGLRNTIGFDWHPQSRELWGMDHGIDWLGDLEHREELNLLVQGGDYGWPFIYDDKKYNLHQNPEETTGLTWAQYAARTAPPVLGLEPHSAPMEMLFYTGSQFPPAYRNNAFVALHGSWNRARPVGYSVVMISYQNGRPSAVQPFLSGFLVNEGQAQFGRPCGLLVAADGSLLVSDDSGGVIYRISYSANP